MNDLDPSADEQLGGESSTSPTDVGDPSVVGDTPRPGPTPPPAPTPVPVDPAADAAARRNWASAAHWTALAAAFFGGFAFLGPLVVWLVKRDQDRWVAAHAVEALNFQLTWFLGAIAATVVGFVLTLVTVGFALFVIVPLALVALVAWIVLPIRGAIAASRAEEFHYPLTVRLVQA